MKTADPKAFLIARTATCDGELGRALREIGVEKWRPGGATFSEDLIEVAGKLCYMSFEKELNANLTRDSKRTNPQYIQEQIVGQHHGSVLEHATATFMFTNISRVVTHELVRHRAGTAFSQVSGRYVRAEPAFYVPRVLRDNPDAVREFKNAVDGAAHYVGALERFTNIDKADFSLKKMLTSAIRRITGNGQANHMVMTANHRAWRHIIEMRTSAGAEEEIRDVIGQVARALMTFHGIYGDMIESEPDSLGLRTYTFKHSKV